MQQRTLLLAAGTCAIGAMLLFGIASSIMDRAQAACHGGGFECAFAGLGEAEWALVGSFLALIAAGVLFLFAGLRWVIGKHREQVVRREIRRLEREVAKLERELEKASH